MRRTFTILAAAVALAVAAATQAFADAGFLSWIGRFRGEALKAGIAARTFDAVFAGIDAPDPEVIEAANFQPEFTAKVWEYMDSRITESVVRTGMELKARHAAWLAAIEKRYGVDRHILLAIWSMESSYGEALATGKGIRRVARSLATLAYANPPRAKFARTQLLAALRIVESGDVSAAGLTGSWAGAMGHTQFIPTSYLAFAVDFDGDGRRDIWTSPQDAIASAANLLRKNGWVSGHAWGYEVSLPAGTGGALADVSDTISGWEKRGVRRVRGASFPRPGDKATLKLPAGPGGPAFLVARNFSVLKRYNNAEKYALAVGLLADRLAGGPALARDWPRGYVLLSEEERMEAQRLLARQGFYDGEIDGKFGPGTRKAAIAFQTSAGLTADGYPSKTLLDSLKAR
jgi:membrane-bound lytic murein transglycosylase B